MRQSDVIPYYKQCKKDIEDLYERCKSVYSADGIEELCKDRGYVNEYQKQYLEDFGIGFCEGLSDVSDFPSEYGLTNRAGEFLLNRRYIVPVRTVNGDLCTLIGYYPDKKKYITLPMPMFSKSAMFLGFSEAYEMSWSEYNGLVFVVEGVFDCLSMQSVGLPCVATMGSTVSDVKAELLKLFRKVIAIPDNDKVGRKALNRSKGGWQVPSTATFLRVRGTDVKIGDEMYAVKDMDNFVSWYEKEDVRDVLLSFANSHEDMEDLIV